MIYSGLTRRLCAFSLDCLIVLGLYMAIGLVLGLSAMKYPLQSLSMLGIWYFGGMIAFSWLYFALLESSVWQATLGKRVLGLKVISEEGERISFWRASVRYFSKVLSRLACFIGFLMILFTKKKQALHDKIAATLVIIQQ
ncbi:MAG: hypothetical protein KR126chlam1_00090 [Chlamydiae bacterium]|nr:hypothetical protein [Chlamydiota bacterium]